MNDPQRHKEISGLLDRYEKAIKALGEMVGRLYAAERLLKTSGFRITCKAAHDGPETEDLRSQYCFLIRFSPEWRELVDAITAAVRYGRRIRLRHLGHAEGYLRLNTAWRTHYCLSLLFKEATLRYRDPAMQAEIERVVTIGYDMMRRARFKEWAERVPAATHHAAELKRLQRQRQHRSELIAAG